MCFFTMLKEQEHYKVQPEDVLRRDEYQILQRAQEHGIPCPWCDQPLTWSFYITVEEGKQHKGVRLSCTDCEFEEW